MSNSSIQKGLIIQGGESVAIARQNDAVYRIEPVPEMTLISIENFESGLLKIIDFGKQLKHDYRIDGITLDVPSNYGGNPNAPSKPWKNYSANAEIKIISKGKAIDFIPLTLRAYPGYFHPILIGHDDVWEVEMNKDVARVNFRCVPIILNPPIFFN